MNAPRTPLPLSPAQLRALAGAAARELLWGQRAVSRHDARWRDHAWQIPDPPLRQAAVRSLTTKRGHTNGAALFTVLPRHRNHDLLRLLVAYEVIWDYLDSAHELAPDEANGRQLHRALVDALDPELPLRDWYRHSPWRDDGGYLTTLVQTCRAAAARLPSYTRVQSLLLREARRGQVLALNHLADASARDAALRRWAADEFPGQTELEWYELSAASSAGLVIFALLALAADADVTDHQVAALRGAYWPSFPLVATMLDSYVDRAEDADNDHHSYVAHYPTQEIALSRIQACIQRAAANALGLARGERHAVILACMVALYLSKDTANAPTTRDSTQRLLSAGGSLARLLAPILRAWRIHYGQRAF